MANVIYRGPAEHEPETINIPLAAALLPGVFVTKDGAAATTGEARLFALGNRRFYDQDIDTAYASGDTGVAYRLAPELEFNMLTVAATFAEGDELTIGTGGALTAAASGDVVVAFADEAKTTASGDLFLDVVIANSYVKTA